MAGCSRPSAATPVSLGAGGGGPTLELAGYLGHASVTTTETHYAALARDEARGAIYAERAFAPALIPDAG